MKTRALAITLASTVVFVAIGFWLDTLNTTRLMQQERATVVNQVSPYANAIIIAFTELTSKLDGLGVFVSLNTRGPIVDSSEFDTYASGLHAASPWVRTFQLVKDGVIRYTYPLAGNEKIVGTNLMKDPRPFIGLDVLRAIERNAPTITGPTNLIQGGFGLIVRQPAYNRDERLLGLVAVVIDLQGFLERAGLQTRVREFRFALADTSGKLFHGDNSVKESSPVTIQVPLPDGFWQLQAIPSRGWNASIVPDQQLFRFNLLAIILLLGGIVYLVVGRQEQLSDLVKKRTQELAQTIGLLEQDIREREIAERSLRESEERNRALLEANPDLMFILRRDGVFLDFSNNSDMEPLLPLDSSMGKSVHELLPADFALEILEHIDRAIASSEPVLHEYQLPIQDEIRNYEARYVKTGEDKVLAIIRDVTERHRARQVLLESELRFRTLAENAPVGIWLAHPDGSGGYVNPRLAEISGLSVESAQGMGWTTRLHPDDRERVFTAWTKFIEGKAPYTLTYRFQRPDGEVRWIIGQAMPSRAKEGQLLGFVGTLADVTDQMRVEEALRASEEKYRQFFEDDLTGDFISTLEGKILSCNPSFARIFGYGSVEEILAVDAHSLYSSRQSRDDFLSLLRKKKRIEYLEAEYVRLDGTPVYTVETAVGIFDEEGKLLRIRGYIFDDTKRRLLEKQFLQAQKLESLGTLAGGIAHDFNNILGIMIGNASLLERHAGNPDAVTKRSAAIIKAGMRGAGLVKQLLTFARKTEVQFETVQLNDIVQEVSGMLTETLPKNISVTLNLDNAVPSVVVDTTQIHQVLLNLCVNARDAMPQGGALTIATGRADGRLLKRRYPNATSEDYITLSVADTGTGMDEQTRRRIFEPFYTTKDRGKGSGLGLSLAFGIMESHSGFIDLATALGEGTTFTLYFPYVKSMEQTLDTGQDRIEDVAGGNETILLVEDEITLRELVEFVLTGKGYNVLTAGDGQEALEAYQRRSEEIHLVLSDLDLPKLSGYEVVKQLKAKNPSLRIVLATGFVEPEAKNALLRGGVSEFVHKPYAVNDLLRTVRAVLDASS